MFSKWLRKVRAALKDVTAATYLKINVHHPLFLFLFYLGTCIKRINILLTTEEKYNKVFNTSLFIRLFTFFLIFNILCNILEPIIL